MGMVGCWADGLHAQCRFCGIGPFSTVPCPTSEAPDAVELKDGEGRYVANEDKSVVEALDVKGVSNPVGLSQEKDVQKSDLEDDLPLSGCRGKSSLLASASAAALALTWSWFAM